VNIEIGVWDQPTGGTQLYGETHSGVALEDGVFNLLLGTGSVLVGSFDADLFATQNRYLEVIVNAEVLTPRQPFSSVAYALQSGESDAAAYATTAGDADTVDGSHAASLDQSAHVSDTGNPHGVTAAQTGGATTGDVDSRIATHAGNASVHHAKTADFGEMSGLIGDGQIPGSITRDSELNAGLAGKSDLGHNHDGRYYTEAEVDALLASQDARIAALEALLSGVTRNGDLLTFGEMNVQVVDGSGDTDGPVNGLGNLFVGYNENFVGATRTGSHNLVVGMDHEYTSYAGLVAGAQNTITGPSASVTGGYSSTASGDASSVSGGRNNTASGNYSSVSGGYGNEASGSDSSVSGGGGNVASGDYSFVGGGGHSSPLYGNKAYSHFSAILGGEANVAGDEASGDPSLAQKATISGGNANVASSPVSHVSGGRNNVASGWYSVVSGGNGLTVSTTDGWTAPGH
jgi:hypothetical protein